MTETAAVVYFLFGLALGAVLLIPFFTRSNTDLMTTAEMLPGSDRAKSEFQKWLTSPLWFAATAAFVVVAWPVVIALVLYVNAHDKA